MTQRTSDISILAQNSMANATQAQEGAFSANNFSFEPSVEDLNRIIRSGDVPPSQASEPEKPKAFFGTHLKEAVAIVKDWVKHP